MSTILVGTDTSAAADLAVVDAARLARARDAELLVLYVRPDTDLRAAVDPALAPDARTYLSKIASRFPDVSTRTRTERGDPAATICEDAASSFGRDRPAIRSCETPSLSSTTLSVAVWSPSATCSRRAPGSAIRMCTARFCCARSSAMANTRSAGASSTTEAKS